MLLRMGVIGCGNFGGQIAGLVAEKGLPAMAFNASDQDMELLSDKVSMISFGDGNGTGKNGDFAIDCLVDKLSFLHEDLISDFINKLDVIFMVASAGGGFGSNTVQPICDMLKSIFTDKLFIIITTMPDMSETYTAQNNTQKFMKNLVELNVPYIIYDNDKYSKLSPNLAAKKINNNIVDDIFVLGGEFISKSLIGGIDARDLLTILSTPGRIVVDKIDPLYESDLEDGSIVQTIKKHITTTGHADVISDGMIIASAISYSVSEDIDKYTSVIKTELQEVFGPHITDYRSEAISENGDSYICTILAGLSLPTTRIDKVIMKTAEMSTLLLNRKSSMGKLGNELSPTIGPLSAKTFGGTKTVKDADIQDKVDDVISKFKNSIKK